MRKNLSIFVIAIMLATLATPALADPPAYPLYVCGDYIQDIVLVEPGDPFWEFLYENGYQASTISIGSLLPLALTPLNEAAVAAAAAAPVVTFHLDVSLSVVKPAFGLTIVGTAQTRAYITAIPSCSGLSGGSFSDSARVAWQPAIGAGGEVAFDVGAASGACGAVALAVASGARSVFAIFPPVIGIPSSWDSTHVGTVTGLKWTGPNGAVVDYGQAHSLRYAI